MGRGNYGPVPDDSALFASIAKFHKDCPGWGTAVPEPTIIQKATKTFEESTLNVKSAARQAERIIEKQNKMKVDSENNTASDVAYLLLGDNKFATLEDTEKVLYYFNGAYRDGGETQIKKICEGLIADCTKNEVSEIIGTIQRKTFRQRTDFDRNDFEVCLLNCVVNIKTGEVMQHDPQKMFRSQIPVKYDKKAQCPKFVRFLHECLPLDDDYIDQLEAFACGLLKNSPKLEAMFFETGKGDNGKSTFLNIINWFYGDDNVSTVSIHELISNRFAKARLENKRVNTFPDIESDALENFGVLKALVSGDAIDAEFKYQNPYTFVNYAKLFFSANELPEIKEKTFATFKRIRITKWTQSFVKMNKYQEEFAALRSKFPDWHDSEIDEELHKMGIHLMNRQFIKSILEDEQEKSGILNLLLVCVRNIIKRDGFFNDYTHEQLNDIWSENSTMIESFVKDCLVRDPERCVPKGKVYQLYHAYCRKNGKPAKSDNVVLPMIQTLMDSETAQKRIGNQVFRVFNGIYWNFSNDLCKKYISEADEARFRNNLFPKTGSINIQKRLSENHDSSASKGAADD